MEYSLQADHLTKLYNGQSPAVNDITLRVRPGEFLTLLGPSGGGKTTTLRLLAGFETPTSGRIQIGDHIVADDTHFTPPEKRKVGMVFQDYALFPHVDAAGNIAFGLRGPRKEQASQVKRLLSLIGLTPFAKRMPYELSGGQQQRVALAPRPFVMLLDEPFSNLDFRLRRQVWEDTLGVLREAGTPTLLVTHDPHEAMKMADRVAVMEAGRILQVGTPSEIYGRPETASIARFFGETTTMRCAVRNGAAATPFVDLPAAGAAEASPVEVVVRPEAFHLDIGPAGHEICRHGARAVDATVVDARHLGPYSLVRFTVGDDNVLVSRAPGLVTPAPGQPIRVHLDPGGAFVFAAETRE